MASIGIRREDKTDQERRAPVAPEHVQQLVNDNALKVYVESSTKRIFNDSEYGSAGAEIVDELPPCDLILGVKEIPTGRYLEGKPHLFFSHVIKAQPYNMPMLKHILDLNCTLLDYELVADENGRRLIFFGVQAGQAGMINTLWSLGKRWQEFGYDTPLAELRQARTYDSLASAKEHIRNIGERIKADGLPSILLPFTIGVAGYGSVSKGAQEILNLLGPKEINPEELENLQLTKEDKETIYKVVFKEEHLVKRIENPEQFDLQEYYNHPELYKSQFSNYLPHLTMLVNAIYWETQYPRLVTNDQVKAILNGIINPKLTVIGDVTCDVKGSIECTEKATMPENPVYVVDPRKGEIIDGFKGEGLQMMTVDILPTEIPLESTIAFGDMLMPFLPQLANLNYVDPLESLNLPKAFKNAITTHRGQLTPGYVYLEKSLV